VSELADAVLAGFGESDWELRHAPEQTGDQRRSAADVSALAGATGWRPQTALEDGMRRTIEWARRSG
jgi:UDP-glucose 4-epimerase